MTYEDVKAAERLVRGFLDDRKIWIVIAYFGLVVAFVIGGVNWWQTHNVNEGRVADQRNQARAAVAGCYVQVRDQPDVIRLLGLLVILADAQIAIAPNENLRLARQSAKRLQDRMIESLPTREQCDRRAAAIGLTPEQADTTTTQ